MSWVRLDDKFPGHPKVKAAGKTAAWLHVAGLCYCAQHLTDGKLSESSLVGLGQFSGAQARKLAERLVEVGLWERNGTGYAIHDYLAYNPSKKDVEGKRRTARERMAKSDELRAK